MPNASYQEKCVECGTPGVVPGENEEVVGGAQLRRTITDEYEEAMLAAEWEEDVEDREKAERRMDHVAKWDHYCPEHAKEIGIL